MARTLLSATIAGTGDCVDGAVFLVLLFYDLFGLVVFVFLVLQIHKFLFVSRLVAQEGFGYGVAVNDDFLAMGLNAVRERWLDAVWSA